MVFTKIPMTVDKHWATKDFLRGEGGVQSNALFFSYFSSFFTDFIQK